MIATMNNVNVANPVEVKLSLVNFLYMYLGGIFENDLIIRW